MDKHPKMLLINPRIRVRRYTVEDEIVVDLIIEHGGFHPIIRLTKEEATLIGKDLLGNEN
jgi:hypothetical protein